MTILTAIAAFALTALGPTQSMMATVSPQAALPDSMQRAQVGQRTIRLVDRVVDGSDFDIFRDRLWQAIQQRDRAFLRERLPAEGIFIGERGPVPVEALALEDANSPFWQSLEKMLAPQSCELEDYPGALPDAAVWGCPNIASALPLRTHPPQAETEATSRLAQVAVVGRRVNVRSRPRLGTSVVGRLTNEVVDLNRRAWQELLETQPATAQDPIDGWTPVILPNQTQGFVYNRYVYHPEGPRVLFEHINGRWQLQRIVMGTPETSLTIGQ